MTEAEARADGKDGCGQDGQGQNIRSRCAPTQWEWSVGHSPASVQDTTSATPAVLSSTGDSPQFPVRTSTGTRCATVLFLARAG